MAGDWIPVQVGIVRRREVLAIAHRMGMSAHEVVGFLVDFWGWVSEESRDGNVFGTVMSSIIAATGGTEAFWNAVIDVGWLEISEDNLTIPNWDRWLGKSAKQRLQANLRKKQWRERQENPVPKKERLQRSKTVATEQNSTSSPLPPCGGNGVGGENDVPDDETEAAWSVYTELLVARKGKAKIQDIGAYVKTIRLKYRHPREAMPEIDQEISRRTRKCRGCGRPWDSVSKRTGADLCLACEKKEEPHA
jgi:hypothetical protein